MAHSLLKNSSILTKMPILEQTPAHFSHLFLRRKNHVVVQTVISIHLKTSSIM